MLPVACTESHKGADIASIIKKIIINLQKIAVYSGTGPSQIFKMKFKQIITGIDKTNIK